MDHTKPEILREEDDVLPVQEKTPELQQNGSLIKLYSNLSAPYYFLLMIGIISSVAGGASLVFNFWVVREMTREIEFTKTREQIAGKFSLLLEF